MSNVNHSTINPAIPYGNYICRYLVVLILSNLLIVSPDVNKNKGVAEMVPL